jgi:hypothetical protein
MAADEAADEAAGADSARTDSTSAVAAGDGSAAAGPVRLGRASFVWRALALVLGLTLVLAGTLVANDDSWPFAPMSQFAFRTDPEGFVESTWIEAQTTDGRRVKVPLNSRGVGIGRAEIEGQLLRIVDDPSLLQAVADAWARRHPDRPRYTRLWLHQTLYPLDGGAAGPPRVETLATWGVPEHDR